MDRTQSTSHRERSVFITVGSTRFDSLVTAASSPDFVALLHSLGYSHLSIQHGRSPLASYFVNAQALADRPIATSAFDYKSSLTEDLMHADLVISHGGSGTILEALRLKKNLVVVVNEELMDNHQQELGTALHNKGYLVCSTVSELENTLKAKGYESLVPFPDPDPSRFAEYLDTRMGL